MSGWASFVSFDKTEESKAYQTQANAHSLLVTRSISKFSHNSFHLLTLVLLNTYIHYCLWFFQQSHKLCIILILQMGKQTVGKIVCQDSNLKTPLLQNVKYPITNHLPEFHKTAWIANNTLMRDFWSHIRRKGYRWVEGTLTPVHEVGKMTVNQVLEGCKTLDENALFVGK